MAYFGGKRDIDLFRTLNNELIHDFISTQVDIYKVIISDSNTNIYGESMEKIFTIPVRFSCLIDYSEQDWNDDKEITDFDQKIKFGFIKDDFRNANFVLDVGDFVSWDNSYWEVVDLQETNYFMGRNPNTNKGIGDQYGHDYAIIANCVMTRLTELNIEPVNINE